MLLMELNFLNLVKKQLALPSVAQSLKINSSSLSATKNLNQRVLLFMEQKIVMQQLRLMLLPLPWRMRSKVLL